MAFTDTSILSADIATMETEFGAASTVTWSGSSYPVMLDVVTKGESLALGGFHANYTSRFYARSSLFSGSKPNVGDVVSFGGKTYSIDKVDTDPDGVGAWYGVKEVYA